MAYIISEEGQLAYIISEEGNPTNDPIYVFHMDFGSRILELNDLP
jgi:hypothetical protein